MVLLLLFTFYSRENLNHKMTRSKTVITTVGHRVTVPRREIGVGLTKTSLPTGDRDTQRDPKTSNIDKLTHSKSNVPKTREGNCLQRMQRPTSRSLQKIQGTALLALQTAFEDYCVELFSISQLAAIHGNRITVKPEDIQLVRLFRGDNMNFNKPTNP